MLFNSVSFILFFPIVTLLFFVIPMKFQYLWLLFASYFFYMCWNAKYALLLLFSTAVTYVSGLLLEKCKNQKKMIVAGSFVLNLGILFLFKYFDFAIVNINRVLAAVDLQVITPKFDVVLPVGISFYVFQALSYTMDVYRSEVKAEKNFFKYALFVSFFPQLVAGPIERSKNLLKQVNEEHYFDFERMRNGLVLMLWGFFQKMVIADRIAIFVDAVYGNLSQFTGWYVIVASVLFAFQIYCDFGGYSNIAIGAAEVMGFKLMENFNCPYFAQSVSEFWRRWHISLSTWFRDYLYIPLGGSRKGRIRKYINLMVVFCLSGLWHGASWTYCIWGALNGIFQIVGDLLKPVKSWFCRVFGVNEKSFGHKLLRGIITFALIDFTWIFFRISSISDILGVMRSVFSPDNHWILLDGSLYFVGLNQKNFHLLIVALVILLFADIMKYKKISIREFIYRQDGWFRWIFYAAAVTVILTFGIWGTAYDAANFIYFQF